MVHVNPQKLTNVPWKGTMFEKEVHLPTINFQGIFVSFQGGSLGDKSTGNYTSPIAWTWVSFINSFTWVVPGWSTTQLFRQLLEVLGKHRASCSQWPKASKDWYIISYTLPETSSSHLPGCAIPKGNDHLPTIHFQGIFVSFREGTAQLYRDCNKPLKSPWRVFIVGVLSPLIHVWYFGVIVWSFLLYVAYHSYAPCREFLLTFPHECGHLSQSVKYAKWNFIFVFERSFSWGSWH